MKKIIYTNHAPEPIGPYSQAILVSNNNENTLYVSGQMVRLFSIGWCKPCGRSNTSSC